MFACTACAPVTAYDCAAYPDARGAPHLRATLSNKTDETVTSVGVFAYTDDSFADYEFTATLKPHETLEHRSGFEFVPGQNPGTRRGHFGVIRSCYARAATFANGGIWSESPL